MKGFLRLSTPALSSKPMNASADQTVACEYERRRACASADEARWRRWGQGVVAARLASGAVLAGALVAGVAGAWSVACWVVGLVAAAAIGCCAVAGDRVGWRQRRCRMAREINEEASARLRRDWDGVPAAPVDVPATATDLDADLDLFGRGSVFHWLCRAETVRGRVMLRDWLLTASPPDEVRRRQQAARLLVPEIDAREAFAVEARLLADRGAAMRPSSTGPQGPPGWPAGRWLRRAACSCRWRRSWPWDAA